MSIINVADLCALNIFKFIDFDFVLNFYDMIEIELFSYKIITIKIKIFNWSLKHLVKSIIFSYHDFLLLDFEILSFKKNWKKEKYEQPYNDSTFTNILWRSDNSFDVYILKDVKFDAYFENKYLHCFSISTFN